MTNTNTPSIEDITKKTARLARLDLSENEQAAIAPKLEAILGMFEELQSLDTDTVEPLANVVGEPLKLREDAVNDGDNPARVLGNAPDETQNFYSVPKVVETEE